MTIIAETDFKLKECKFYINSRHLASCYPEKSKSSMTTNVHRYMNGEIKSFNNRHYFRFEYDGIPLTEQNLSKMQREALDIARAQLKNRNA